MRPPPIEAEPASWKDLEQACARILSEAGYVEVTVGKELELARGSATLDVYAVDPATPAIRVGIECKNWATPVPKTIVHAFRTVAEDAGLNLAMIVSRAGFQAGAREAARNSNVDLVDWLGLQALFVNRWFASFAVPTGRAASNPLIEYTEPINWRVQRKAEKLAPPLWERFLELRQRHFDLGMGLLGLWWSDAIFDNHELPALPLRAAFEKLETRLPDPVLDAPTLRELLDAVSAACGAAVSEFDDVLGERA